MLSSKDLNFVGYTYKNFELVNEHEASGIGFFFSISSISVHYSLFIFVFTIKFIYFLFVAELKKVSKSKRPTIKSLFGNYFAFIKY
jgi:serine/threonine kinase 38